MDLERSLHNISIDDNPWRQHDPQQVWGSGMQPNAANQQQTWGHMSPQQQMRSLWQDPNAGAIGQGVNEGIGGVTPANQGWGGPMSGAHSEYEQKIWADPLDAHYSQGHPHNMGSMNGMMGDPAVAGGEWSNGGQPGQIWSDNVNKEPDYHWKHQQQQQQGGWGGPPGGNMGAWPPRQMGHPNGPPPHGGPRGGPMMQQHHDSYPGNWQQNGGMMRQNKPMPWNEQPRMPGMPRTGGRGPQQQGRFQGPNMGVDVTVPPPMDMQVLQDESYRNGTDKQPVQHMGQGMGMRQGGPPPGGPASWKPNNVPGDQNDFRKLATMSNLWGSREPPPQVMQFPINGPEDWVWHDPNGDLKKWQRDTGVSSWGDPEKNVKNNLEERPIRLWLIPEGEEEDLETALMKCPVPQKKGEDGASRLPFPIPVKRPIVVTGWGELPENDPNNPSKNEDGNKWADVGSGETPWYLPGQQTSNQFTSNDTTTTWVQGGNIPLDGAAGGGNNTHAIAEMLKFAVEKGYLDMNIMRQPSLPPPVLYHMNLMLIKIPALESVENELKQLVESVRPEGDATVDNSSPQKWMNDVQKVEYNRLIIDVTTAKIEVTELSKKVQRALAEAGIVNQSEGNHSNVPTSSQNYHYSFLE